MVGGKPMRLVAFSISVIALPSDASGARLKETVTEGNCPWWLIESASVMGTAAVKALRGITFAPTDAVSVLGVVPEVVPPVADEPLVEIAPASTLAGWVRTPEVGVYFTDVVTAFDPAAAEADEEKEVAAPAPV